MNAPKEPLSPEQIVDKLGRAVSLHPNGLGLMSAYKEAIEAINALRQADAEYIIGEDEIIVEGAYEPIRVMTASQNQLKADQRKRAEERIK